MKKIKKELLEAWLKNAPDEINIEELGKWLENKSKGEYNFMQKDSLRINA